MATYALTRDGKAWFLFDKEGDSTLDKAWHNGSLVTKQSDQWPTAECYLRLVSLRKSTTKN